MKFWSWLQSFFRKPEPSEPRIVSLVLLLDEPRFLDSVILRHLAERAFGVEFDESPDAENSVVSMKKGGCYLIRAGREHLVVNNFPTPYVEDVQKVGREIAERRFRQAFLAHRAWLSVDLLFPPEKITARTFRWIGRLTAELIDGDCTAIFCPTNCRGSVYHPDQEAALRSANPLQIFEGHQTPPVIDISNDDPEMQRAVRQARRKWPLFVEAFQNRKPDDLFSVKVPIRDRRQTEYMWIAVSAIENDVIYGRLDNDPLTIRSVSSGDWIHVPVAELNDWLYVSEDQQHGAFTLAILMAKQNRREKH